MNFYNCGFYLGYLHNLQTKITELNLESVLKCLCIFSCEAVIPFRNSQKPTPTDSKLIAVYENLLGRGLPTFPSLLVERTLAGLPHPHIPIHEESETGSFEFRHQDLDAETEEDWLNLLKKAHYIIDPRLTANDLLSESFDSCEEKKFFSELLPEFLGSYITQLVEPQRLFETLIDSETATEFARQRVDFALETDQIKAVFEVDGEQHEEPRQRRLDERRDRILRNNGWTVFRISARDVRSGRIEPTLIPLRDEFATNPFTLTERNYQSPLWETELGQQALQLVLTPFAVARLQKILLLALRASTLSLNQSKWKLVIVERGVPCAQLAILDFLQTLQEFYRLLEINKLLPQVELLIYTTPEFERASSGVLEDQLSEFRINTNQQVLDSQNAETFDGDLLIDISVLQRYGFTKPEPDFCNRLLGSNGAAFSIRSAHTPRSNTKIQPSEPIAYPMTDDKREPLRFFLQNLFRKKDFRKGQFEILTRSLAQRSVIGLLPTGAGKSLCYQLSALLQPGVTLVVDPLRSLMFDQAENLKINRIDRIAFINSEQEAWEREETIRQMANGEFQIVFISPERLQIKKFREELRRMTTDFSVPYVVIDEAHCVSEWGHDFRTSYLNLTSTVQDFNISPTIVALTGTASYAVLTDIQREIRIDDEEAKIQPSTFDRPELQFSLYTVPSNKKRSKLSDILKAIPNQLSVDADSFYEPNEHRTHSGIVFVPHVDGAFGEAVRTFLYHELGIPIEFYGGGVPKTFEPNLTHNEKERCWNEHKRSVQQRFKTNEFPLLVSTKAFGMGIDKPNIRYTIHYGIPQSLEAFYQEAGRAGRDGEDSICTIIFSDDSAANADKFLDGNRGIDEFDKLWEPPWGQQGDIHRMMWFQKNSFQGVSAEKKVIRKLLEGWIYPHFRDTLQLNQSEEIQIPFGGSDSIKMKREKAIYRLSIIGVVQDYTIDFGHKKFEVTIVKRPDDEYLAQLQNYIARYKTQDRTVIAQQVQQHKGRNLIEKCLGYLIDFVYEEIEKKRRRAIQTMAEVVRTCDTDEKIREALLSYLEKSRFTEPLLQLAGRIESQEWWDVLDINNELDQPLLSEVDGARQLLWGCRRTLESFPSHPGLYLLSGFARLLLPNQEVEQALNDIRSGFQNLTDPSISKREEIILEFLRNFEQWFESIQNFEMIQANIAAIALNTLRTRTIAHAVYRINPVYTERILLNWILQDIENFNQQFLGGTQNAR